MHGDSHQGSVNRNHTVFVYKTESERQRFLVEYFKEGLTMNHLCVFVSPDSKRRIINDFKRSGLDISHAVKTGGFRIYDMQQTYLPHGEFTAEFMIQNVRQFIEDAGRAGYSGLYTAGEMSWMYNNPRFWHKAAWYEREVDNLQKNHETFTALCLYPTTESPFIEEVAFRNHPTQVFKGGVVANELAIGL